MNTSPTPQTTMKNSTTRFSDRVDNYLRYRPDYPQPLIEFLLQHGSLDQNSLIADIGSGTGIFTRHLLDKQLKVLAVEPNHEMRHAAEKQLSHHPRFTSIEGTAEKTNLPDSSINLIVAAQAFHWFDRHLAKKEFHRILKPSGHLALIWNQRKLDLPFQQEYDQLLIQHAPEYKSVNHRDTPVEIIEQFFSPASFEYLTFDNSQQLDKQSFLGRIQSSSYTPAENTPEFLKLKSVAELLFDKHQSNGFIRFEYDAQIYRGQLP